MKTRVKLRILATTDLHMQVLPFDYQTGETSDRKGLARTAALIKNARREVANTILVDNGDFLSGADTGIISSEVMQDNHPMIAVMNYLQYDAATPGNHDFDNGLQFLMKITSQARFPFISANALIKRGPDASKDSQLFSSFTILEREVSDTLGQKHQIRVGLTGFLPPNSVAQYDANDRPIQTRDILEAAKAIIPRLKAAGADIIIALAHSGIGSSEYTPRAENAVIPLAQIDGIDAIVAGHTHQTFPGPNWSNRTGIDAIRGLIHNKPVVSAGFGGSHLGLIDLDLVCKNNSWSVIRGRSTLRAIYSSSDTGKVTSQIASDNRIIDIAAPTHKAMLRGLTKHVGSTLRPISSFFSQIAPSRAMQEVQHAQLWCVRNCFSDYFDAEIPLLSSTCPYKTGGYGGPENYTHIKPGKLLLRSIVDLYPFPNKLALLKITGADLREWLERAASNFNQFHPGKPLDILSCETPGYFYDTVLGVQYQIDLNQPARYSHTGQLLSRDHWRIHALTYKENPVQPDDRFTLITNNYRLGGGGFYPTSCLNKATRLPNAELQKLLPEYFSTHLELNSEIEENWRFKPIGGAQMLFYSAPRAVEHLSELPDGLCAPLEQTCDGFQMFNINL